MRARPSLMTTRKYTHAGISLQDVVSIRRDFRQKISNFGESAEKCNDHSETTPPSPLGLSVWCGSKWKVMRMYSVRHFKCGKVFFLYACGVSLSGCDSAPSAAWRTVWRAMYKAMHAREPNANTRGEYYYDTDYCMRVARNRMGIEKRVRLNRYFMGAIAIHYELTALAGGNCVLHAPSELKQFFGMRFFIFKNRCFSMVRESDVWMEWILRTGM